MKIRNLEIKKTELTAAHKQLEGKQPLCYEKNEIPNTESKEFKGPLLIDQILTIQRAKTSLSLESLAASNLPTNEYTALIDVADLDEKYWKKYNYFHCSQEKLEEVVTEMRRLLGNQEVSEGTKITYYENYTNNITNKLLVKVVRGNKVVQKWGWSFEPPLKQSQIIAAEALRIMIQKAGNTEALPTYKESELINLLLNSPIREIRLEGALAARETYKHEWRKGLEATGLIAALKTEEDNVIRSIISYAIIHANPQAIFKSYSVAGTTDFIPISRSISDECVAVKSNLLVGARRYLEASEYRGIFYADFRERTFVEPEEIVISLRYSLKNLEDLFFADFSDENNSLLFRNATMATIESVSQRGVSSSHRESDDFGLLEKLSSIDLIRFIESMSKINNIDKRNFNGVAIDTWNDCSQLIDIVLKLKIRNNGLIDFIVLREGLNNKKETTNDQTFQTNFSKAIDKVDDTIQSYIKNTHYQSISWGGIPEFNATFAKLVDLLKNSKRDSLKVTIMILIDNCVSKGLNLKDLENVKFEDILSDHNKLHLKEILRELAHSKPASNDTLANLRLNTVQGKAIDSYRKLSRSFKDYFGTPSLKEKALQLASISISGKNSQESIGLLLSGTPGTGKSLFAEVLANEIAVPLEEFICSKIEEGDQGKLYYTKGDSSSTFAQYVENLKKVGPCILLIDEIDRITSPQKVEFTLQLIELLESIRQAKLPVFIIGTTNFPAQNAIKGFTINDDGSSQEINNVLSQKIHPNLFPILQPCYIFYRKDVGVDFTKEYSEYLVAANKLDRRPSADLLYRYSKGLTPAEIITATSTNSAEIMTQEKFIEQLKTLKLHSNEIVLLANLIRSKLESLTIDETHLIYGEIDYKELALIVEDLPIKSVGELLTNAPSQLNQKILVNLLNESV